MRFRRSMVVALLMSLAACASTPSARLNRVLSAYAGTFDHSVVTEMSVDYWGALRWAQRPGLCIADGVIVPHSVSAHGPRKGSLRFAHMYGAVGDIERAEESLTEADIASERAACEAARVTTFFSLGLIDDTDADLAVRGARAFARLVADGCGSVRCDAATRTAVDGLKGLRLRQVSYCRPDDETCVVLDAGDVEVHTVFVTLREEPTFEITALRGESGIRVD